MHYQLDYRAKPEPPTLRPYQQTALAKFLESDCRRQLFVSPTGSGKTVFFCAAVAEITRDPTQHVLIVVHRKELVDQIVTTLRLFGIEPGIIMAGRSPSPLARVQVASIQSFVARFDEDTAPFANWVFVDEAHHSVATTYRRIFSYYENSRILGVTATPCRGDGRGLGSDFDTMHAVITVKELIEQGYLVKTRVFSKALPLKGIKIVAGDYNVKQLARHMDTDELVGHAVVEYLAHAGGRSAIVFAVDVAHAQHLANEFNRHGIQAACIHADTCKEERDSVRDRLRNGELRIVCNVGIYTEGFDAPDVGCVILCRPTKSLSLFLQMVGRGLRPAPGKDHLVLIDHAGGIFAHGFVDDDREWTLDEDRGVKNVDAANRKPDELCDCPGCGTLRKRGPTCDYCDWQPQTSIAAADFKTSEGFLVEVERDGEYQHSRAEKIAWIAGLKHIVAERGWKPGSVYRMYLEKFGSHPPIHTNSVPAEPPTMEVRNWVKSRIIAYAKAKEKAKLADVWPGRAA
jgi:DNA repair protein RadD